MRNFGGRSCPCESATSMSAQPTSARDADRRTDGFHRNDSDRERPDSTARCVAGPARRLDHRSRRLSPERPISRAPCGIASRCNEGRSRIKRRRCVAPRSTRCRRGTARQDRVAHRAIGHRLLRRDVGRAERPLRERRAARDVGGRVERQTRERRIDLRMIVRMRERPAPRPFSWYCEMLPRADDTTTVHPFRSATSRTGESGCTTVPSDAGEPTRGGGRRTAAGKRDDSSAEASRTSVAAHDRTTDETPSLWNRPKRNKH